MSINREFYKRFAKVSKTPSVLMAYAAQGDELDEGSLKPCEHCNAPQRRYTTPEGNVANACWDCGTYRIRQTAEREAEVQGSWSRNAGVQRETHKADMLQPFKPDGQVNRQFVEKYGTGAYKKHFNMSDEQVRKDI